MFWLISGNVTLKIMRHGKEIENKNIVSFIMLETTKVHASRVQLS